MTVEYDEKHKETHIYSPTYNGPTIKFKWPENYWLFDDLRGGTQVIHARKVVNP